MIKSQSPVGAETDRMILQSDAALKQRIGRELMPGEEVRWSGRPARGLKLRPGDVPLVILGVMVLCFGIVVVCVPAPDLAPLLRRNPLVWPVALFLLFIGLTATLAGANLVFGRIIWDIVRRSRTVYAVTNRRAIILTDAIRSLTRSINLAAVSDVTLTERPDGTGDVMLGPFDWRSSLFVFPGAPFSTRRLPPTLESVPDAREVFAMVRHEAYTASARCLRTDTLEALELDEAAERQLAAELDPNERLLWAARPIQGLRFKASDVLAILYGLPCLAGGCLLELAAFLEPRAPLRSLLAILWGIPFVLIGAFVTFGRFPWDAKRRSRTFYGVTDQRVILVEGFLRTHIRSIGFGSSIELSFSEDAKDRGDVVLGSIAPLSLLSLRVFGWARAQQLAALLESVPRARDVYDLIRRARRAW